MQADGNHRWTQIDTDETALAGESACPTGKFATRRLCAGICRKTQDLDPPGRLIYHQGEQIWKTRIAVSGTAHRVLTTVA